MATRNKRSFSCSHALLSFSPPFFCFLQPGMKSSLSLLPSPYQTPPSLRMFPLRQLPLIFCCKDFHDCLSSPYRNTRETSFYLLLKNEKNGKNFLKTKLSLTLCRTAPPRPSRPTCCFPPGRCRCCFRFLFPSVATRSRRACPRCACGRGRSAPRSWTRKQREQQQQQKARLRSRFLHLRLPLLRFLRSLPEPREPAPAGAGTARPSPWGPGP